MAQCCRSTPKHGASYGLRPLDALLVQSTRAVNDALLKVALALGWILFGARFSFGAVGVERRSKVRANFSGVAAVCARRPHDFTWCSRGLCGCELVAADSSSVSSCAPPTMPPQEGNSASRWWMVDAEPLWQCDSLRVERRPRECRVLHCQLGAVRPWPRAARSASRVGTGASV